MAKKSTAKNDFISARTILWYVVFMGFAVNYMIRLNMNIALVAMIKQKPDKDTLVISSECIGNKSTVIILNNVSINENETIQRDRFINFTSSQDVNSFKTLEEEYEDEQESKRFAWNEYHQGTILGAYFWFHWLTQIPGGILAQKYGTKLVFGLANFSGVVLCFFIPFSAYLSYEYLVFLRALQGLVTGFAWPAMHHMAAKWIPPNERSSFVSAYLGSSVGAALTYPMCGWIINRWGWEWAFYSNGILGAIWFLVWWLYIFDSPEEHPRISEDEKDYILSHLEQHKKFQNKPAIPWRSIFTSPPIWMNILAQWGGIWGLFTLMIHAPMYFKVTHGWDIKATGLLSGMPHILRVSFAIIFSQLGDYLLKSNKMSRTNVRKLAVTQCCVMQGIFMLLLAYSGCNSTAAIIFLSGSVAVNGAVSTGPLASLVDISPNYASIALGMCNTIVAIVGFLVPTVVSYITFENQTVSQWQKVFWLATVMLLVSGVLYLFFAKSEVQPWNSPNGDGEHIKESEMKCLRAKESNDVHLEPGLDMNGTDISVEKEND